MEDKFNHFYIIDPDKTEEFLKVLEKPMVTDEILEKWKLSAMKFKRTPLLHAREIVQKEMKRRGWTAEALTAGQRCVETHPTHAASLLV
jgi:hypothetical protein